MEQEQKLVGKRIIVRSDNGHRLIGRGTYVWMGALLLDTGEIIQEGPYSWTPSRAKPPQPFTVVLAEDARVFGGNSGAGGNLHSTTFCLKKGDRITLRRIEVRGWNHGNYLAAEFTFTEGAVFPEEYFLLVSELKFERAPPKLRLVG